MFVLQNYGCLLYIINNNLRMYFIFFLCIIENGISYKLKHVCNIIYIFSITLNVKYLFLPGKNYGRVGTVYHNIATRTLI